MCGKDSCEVPSASPAHVSPGLAPRAIECEIAVPPDLERRLQQWEVRHPVRLDATSSPSSMAGGRPSATIVAASDGIRSVQSRPLCVSRRTALPWTATMSRYPPNFSSLIHSAPVGAQVASVASWGCWASGRAARTAPGAGALVCRPTLVRVTGTMEAIHELSGDREAEPPRGR